MGEKILRVMTLAIIFGLGLGSERGLAAGPLEVKSPDGRLSVAFELKINPQPFLPGERAYYRVSYNGRPILTDSPLGLDFKGAPALDRDFEIVATDLRSHDDLWDNPFGAQRRVRDHYNQLTVSLRERNAPERRVDLIFRAYDEGLAFRYLLPQQEALEKFVLASENTGFYFAQDTDAFALDLGRFNTNNEGEYRRVRLSAFKPASVVNLPLLVEMPGGPWVALLEADLTDYAGMYVGGVPGVDHALISRLSPSPRRLDEVVVGSAPKATPWRVLLVNMRPGGLIETNYLILNLSAPCALADTSWIKPGKAAWDWWSGSFARGVDFKPGMNTPTMRHYIDFAATHHLEYMLVDSGWYPATDYSHPIDILRHVPEVDVPSIIAYAKQKGVKVILWVFWGELDKHLDEALTLYEKWGAAGIKVDFMDRDDQAMVNFYERCVRKAAEHHMVVDFHGAYKPTGLRRTLPNLLTIPFTRMLAGPMDYTPGGFHNATRAEFKPRHVEPMTQGTRAHELAKYVVYESQLAMVSDYPEAYEGQPGIEFIEKVPTVWDDTKVLNGEPGKYITVARRNGETWYLGAMTNWDARDLEIPLNFLGSGEYEAQIFADGPDADKDATSLRIDKKRVKATDKFNLHLAPGGGVAIIVVRVP
jgi:alpha-glucosidase